jgi:hypothetical protein
MFEEAGEVDPLDAIMPESLSLNMDYLRIRFASELEGLANESEDLLLGGIVVLVAHLGTDEVGELTVVGGEGLCHYVGGLFLFVDFPAVGDDGKVEEVASVAGNVVQAPKALFVPRRVIFLGEPIVSGGLGKSGSGMHDRPLVRVTGSEMPSAGSTHGKPHQGDASLVYAVFLLHGLDGL